jgi:hypothetical protein
MSTNCEKKSAFDHTQHNLTISLKKTHPIGIFKIVLMVLALDDAKGKILIG